MTMLRHIQTIEVLGRQSLSSTLPRRCISLRKKSPIPCSASSTEIESSSKIPVRRVDAFRSLTDIWSYCAEFHGEKIAVRDPHHTPEHIFTYHELKSEIDSFGYGLKSLGLEQSQAVALFSDNSCRWIVADQAIMLNGCFDAVRGAAAPYFEMQQILQNSESVGIIVQDSKVLLTLLNQDSTSQSHPNGYPANLPPQIKFIVLLWGGLPAAGEVDPGLDVPVFTYEEVLRKGEEFRKQNSGFQFPEPGEDQVATVVYTSGTSGIPKGVPLSQENILYQIRSFKGIIGLTPGDQILSLLPPWHIYERSVAYYFFSQGVQMVYSNVKTFKTDLALYPSEAFIAVPLVLDVLYKKVMSRIQQGSLLKKFIGMSLMNASIAFIQQKRILNGVDLRFALTPPSISDLTKAFLLFWMLTPFHLLARNLVHKNIREGIGIQRVVVSGGSSLGSHLDDFFESIGLVLINGWGLTETSPVICCRLPEPYINVRGTVGTPLPRTQIKVVDPQSLEEVEDGQTGLVLVRGPAVMRAYHRNPQETEKVMLPDGWFNTGDRGWRCPSGILRSQMAGNLVLTGRMKDTIVLSSGENVEPQPIEDCLCVSPLISHLMVVGQDHRHLGALIVPDPEVLNKENLEVEILEEVWKLEKQQRDYLPYMHILAISVLDRPFSIEDGTLTRTMKIRREAIMKLYSTQIEELLRKLR